MSNGILLSVVNSNLWKVTYTQYCHSGVILLYTSEEEVLPDQYSWIYWIIAKKYRGVVEID